MHGFVNKWWVGTFSTHDLSVEIDERGRDPKLHRTLEIKS